MFRPISTRRILNRYFNQLRNLFQRWIRSKVIEDGPDRYGSGESSIAIITNWKYYRWVRGKVIEDDPGWYWQGGFLIINVDINQEYHQSWYYIDWLSNIEGGWGVRWLRMIQIDINQEYPQSWLHRSRIYFWQMIKCMWLRMV